MTRVEGSSARPSWHEARAIAAEGAPTLPHERLALRDGVGRRLARDVVTPIDIPHFASSAMDGWLTIGEGPWRIVNDHPTGGEARTIVTGALITEPGASVLRTESAVANDGMLRSTSPSEPRPAHHVRATGAEALHGDTIIAAGTVLNPVHIALVAATGADELWVHAEPDIALILTGDEIVESGIPAPGQVRDSFGIQLPALLRQLGGRVRRTVRVGDALDETLHALAACPEPMIVTTGGTGSSGSDFVRSALDALGADILIDGVAMRPGGPTTMARLRDGRIVLCLPGNPLAAMLAAITIAEPAIARLGGWTPRPTRMVEGIDLVGRAGSTVLRTYRLVDGIVTLTSWQGSAMLRGLADAHGLLVVPEPGTVVGMPVESVDLPWATEVD